MSDEDYLRDLHNIRGTMVRDQSWTARAIAVIDHAIRSLTPKPVAENCVQVRVAVAVNDGGSGTAWLICRGETDEDGLDGVRDPGYPHVAIIAAPIPRRLIPIVEGKVEP